MMIKYTGSKTSIMMNIILSILFLTNCALKTNQVIDNEIRHIQLPKSGEDILNVSYFADTVIYLPLETTKESLINGIDKLWMNDSLILISSWKIGIMQFSRDGKFIKKIGYQGNGPGEYQNIYTFSVVNDTVYIPNFRNGVVRYTLDGIFCDEIFLNNNPLYLSNTTDQKLSCYLENEGKVIVYNQGFHIADSIIVEYGVTEGRYFTIQMDFSEKPYLYNTFAGMLFNSFRSDTIWRIAGTTRTPAYILETNDKMLPYDKQIEFFADDLDEWGDIIKAYNYFHLIPFPSINIIFQRKWSTYFSNYQAIYLDDLKTGEVKRYNTSFIFDDIVGNQKLLNSPRVTIHTTFSEEYLVTSISPIDIIDFIDKNKDNPKDIPSVAFVDQMKKIKEDNNPILVLMKIKK